MANEITLPVHVFVVASHQFVCKSVTTFLQTVENTEVVGCATTSIEIAKLPNAIQPRTDVILLDVDSQSGVEQQIIADMRQTVPSTPLVVVTLHVQAPLIRGLLGMGVQGCLAKDVSTWELFVGLRSAAEGSKALSASMTEALLNHTEHELSVRAQARLTPRETELLTLLLEGRQMQKIAEIVHLSEHTVRNYASIIYDKLEVKSKGELIAKYGGGGGKR